MPVASDLRQEPGADTKGAAKQKAARRDLRGGREVTPAPTATSVAGCTPYPARRIIHVFLDNARYHHARAVQDWLAMPGRRIRLHFVPAYCPHLNPIERLWGLMHKTVTHNRCYATYNGFCQAVLGF